MNKKLPLAVIAAGFIGCAGYNAASNVAVITQPVQPRVNESEFFEHTFQDREERECYRSVYVSYNFKTERLQSILRIEHCFTQDRGDFHWTRLEDINDDGIVDRDCWQEKSTYIDLKLEGGKIHCDYACTGASRHDCFEGYRLFYRLHGALSWVKPPSLQP